MTIEFKLPPHESASIRESLELWKRQISQVHQKYGSDFHKTTIQVINSNVRPQHFRSASMSSRKKIITNRIIQTSRTPRMRTFKNCYPVAVDIIDMSESLITMDVTFESSQQV
jgi:hypothetical protein